MNKITPYIDCVNYLCHEASKEKLLIIENILQDALKDIKSHCIQQESDN